MKISYFSEIRHTLWLALPFITNQVLQMSVVTIDSLMAGADSKLTLAAVAIGTILWHFVLLGMIGVLLPTTAMYARLYSRSEYKLLRIVFQQSIWLAIPLGLIGFILTFFLPDLMYLVGVDATIIPHASGYLEIVAFTIPLIACFLPIRYLNEGIGNPMAVMLMTATSIPINILGNYLLINGLLGFPKMGATGVAVSTLVSTIYLLGMAWLYVLKSNKLKKLALLDNFSRPLLDYFLRLIKLGIPNSLALLMESAMFTTVMLLSGRLGVDVAAANQITFNYISNAFMIPLGISMALTTRIGMAMGNHDIVKVRTIGISGMGLGAGFMIFSIIGIIIFGRQIAALYTHEETVINIATDLLALAGLFQIFDGIQVCGAGALRGMEETQAPMRCAIIGYWLLGIPLAIILAFVLELGAAGLWWGLVVGLGTAAILIARKFLYLTRQKISLQTD